MLFWGMARFGGAAGWLEQLFCGLVRLELVDILKGGDATATAFRSKSPLTGLFRGITRLKSSSEFVRNVSEGLSKENLNVMELILNQLKSSPPTTVIVVLRALNEELKKCNLPQPERLVAFFFFTRYLVPQMIAMASAENRSLIMSYAKEMGALVAEDSITALMQTVLAIGITPTKQGEGSNVRVNLQMHVQKALGLLHDSQSRAGELCFFEAAATYDKGSRIAYLWSCAVTRDDLSSVFDQREKSSSRTPSRKASLAKSSHSSLGTPPKAASGSLGSMGTSSGHLDLRGVLSSLERTDSW
jgi:hypothetical protein